MLIKTDVRQLPDGYLDRTPMFQYILLSDVGYCSQPE